MADFLFGNTSQMVGTQAVGDTYRGIGADWFNAENVAKEDFARQDQLNSLQHSRDLEKLGIQNKFNAEQAEIDRLFQSGEAKKAYARQRELRQSAYQDTVKDLKAAGLNPLLAVQQGATSASSAPQASGSVAQSGSGGVSSSAYRSRALARTSDLFSMVASLASTASGLYNAGQSRASSEAMNAARIASNEALKNRVSHETFIQSKNGRYDRYKKYYN